MFFFLINVISFLKQTWTEREADRLEMVYMIYKTWAYLAKQIISGVKKIFSSNIRFKLGLFVQRIYLVLQLPLQAPFMCALFLSRNVSRKRNTSKFKNNKYVWCNRWMSWLDKWWQWLYNLLLKIRVILGSKIA